MLTVSSEMQRFADQCTSNLAMWEARLKLPSTNERPPSSPERATPTRSPEDFLTSFPLTLPTFVLSYQDDHQPAGEWHTYSPSSPSPSSSSSSEAIPDNLLGDQLSPPASPSPSVGSTSFVLAPRSSSSSLRTNSSTSGAAAAMRAAYEAGVRKKRSFYNRYSWSADLSPVSSTANLHAVLPKAIMTNTMPVNAPSSPCVGVGVAGSLKERASCVVGSVQ